jgi:hypothetical protein
MSKPFDPEQAAKAWSMTAPRVSSHSVVAPGSLVKAQLTLVVLPGLAGLDTITVTGPEVSS